MTVACWDPGGAGFFFLLFFAVVASASQETKFVTWKLGDAAWHQVAVHATQAVRIAFVAAGVSGKLTLVVVSATGTTYRLASYQL